MLDAVNHRAPERVPATLYLDDKLRQNMRTVPELRDLVDGFEDDTVRILWNIEAEFVDAESYRDPFGILWQRAEGMHFYVDPPLTEPDASKIPHIRLVTDAEVERILRTRRENPDKFIYYQFHMTFGERLWAYRGMEEYLMDLSANPEFIHEALDKLVEMHLEALEIVTRLPVDGITFGDDFGSQKGLMISPKAFRTFFKDRLALLYSKVKEAGMVVGGHSCGDTTELMGDFVDMGLQVFHPLQAECMDIRAIKKQFGKNLSFRGGMGVQRTVVHGTPSQVRTEVLQAARILSEGGGYLMEPCKPLPPETPMENASAFIQALQDARRYAF